MKAVAKRLGIAMIKSELVDRLAARHGSLDRRSVERAVEAVLLTMARALARGQRVEIRGFGALSVKLKPARTGRNPRLGTTIQLAARRLPYFRCGKLLYERLNTESQEEVRELAGAAE